MSVASIGPLNSIYTANTPKKIEVDFKKLRIDPEEKGIIDIGNSMNLQEALKDEGALVNFMAATTVVFTPSFRIDQTGYKQTLDQKPAMTFRSAVETVVKALNNYAAKNEYERESFFRFDITGKNLESQLIIAIWNIETKTNGIPKPPQLVGDESWANETHTRNWLGAILSVLHDNEYIRSFGYKADIGFWVKL